VKRGGAECGSKGSVKGGGGWSVEGKKKRGNLCHCRGRGLGKERGRKSKDLPEAGPKKKPKKGVRERGEKSERLLKKPSGETACGPFNPQQKQWGRCNPTRSKENQGGEAKRKKGKKTKKGVSSEGWGPTKRDGVKQKGNGEGRSLG